MSNLVPVRIRVTKRDITMGNPGDENSCPIARSLKRVTNCKVKVMGEEIVFGLNKVDAPKWVRKFVEVFDDSIEPERMKPRRRTVHVPASVLKRFN